MPEVFARVSRSTPLIALGPRTFRKELLRLGTWSHPDAPGGKLEVTQSMFDKIIENFRLGVRDDVPVPLGHDLDAVSNTGHVIGLETTEDGRLFGLIQIKKDDVADDIEDGTITGGSALINLNHRDHESGAEHGPTLVHWAITNAPYIKGLSPYEAVALGEDGKGATIISLNDRKEGSVDPIRKALEALKESSDEDIQKALAELRPGVLKVEEGSETSPEDLERIKAEAKEEGQKELVAALSEAGLKVELPAGGEKAKDDKSVAAIDISSHPAFVALSEEVKEVKGESAKKNAEGVIDAAIADGKVLPTQKEGLLEVALSEGGMDRLAKLIPDKAVVDLKEIGTDAGRPTNVGLSEEDAEAEAERYVSAYTSQAKKGGE